MVEGDGARARPTSLLDLKRGTWNLKPAVRLVVGLGNPGLKYRHTPHNLGYEVVDILASRHGGEFRRSRRFRAGVATVTIGKCAIALMRPATYMNLSGEAVAPFARYRAIAPEEILVACDDIDLPIGRLRLRPRNGPGSHKGLISIIEALGSSEFARLRIGTDPGEPIDDLTDYVLTPWWGERREAIEPICTGAADAIERAIEAGLSRAMSEFNGRDFLEPDSAPAGEQ